MIRIWMFAITVLLLAEDFQYLLKAGNIALEQEVAEEYRDGEDAGDPEGKQENEEEKKEEKKDEDKNSDGGALLFDGSQRLKNIFCDAHSFFLCFPYELESPPPEF